MESPRRNGTPESIVKHRSFEGDPARFDELVERLPERSRDVPEVRQTLYNRFLDSTTIIADVEELDALDALDALRIEPHAPNHHGDVEAFEALVTMATDSVTTDSAELNGSGLPTTELEELGSGQMHEAHQY